MDDIVELGHQAAKIYAMEGMLPSLPINMSSHDYDVWLCCFEQFPKAWMYYAILKERAGATESFENYCSAPSTFHMSTIGYLVHAIVKLYSPQNLHRSYYGGNEDLFQEWISIFTALQKEVISIWMKTFKDHKPELIKSLHEANNLHNKYFPESAARIKELIEKEVQTS